MGVSDEPETDGRTLPKSIRHKHILDIAADKPEASLETIAEEVPSATTDLVEHVLDEYGDPASNGGTGEEVDEDDHTNSGDVDSLGDNEVENSAENGTFDDNEELTHPTSLDLTDDQREVLRTVYEHPEATQREIGAVLDVSAATICNRVKAIEGFDWKRRRTFVEAVFDSHKGKSEPEATNMEPNQSDDVESQDELLERVTTLEEQLAEIESNTDIETGDGLGLEDTELIHKVLHACLTSENITEDEELRILEAFLQ